MSPIEIAPAKSSQVHNDEFAARPGAHQDSEKKFGDLMDRTLARTNQKSSDRDPQATRKTAKKNSIQPDAKVADTDDADTDTTSDDKHKVTTTQSKADDTNTAQPLVVPPLQMFPLTAQMVKLAGLQGNGDAKAAMMEDASSTCVSPVDLQLASSSALLSLQGGKTSGKSATDTATAPTLPSTDSKPGKDSLTVLAATDGKADVQAAVNPDDQKTEKAGHQPVFKESDTTALPNGAATDEKTGSDPKTVAKDGMGNSILKSAELATANANQAANKADSSEKPNEIEVSAMQNASGISAAQQDVQMKKAEKKNKIAGAEKVLPQTAVSPDSGDNLPAADKLSASSTTFDRVDRADNTLLNTAPQDRPVEAAATSVDKASVDSSVVDIRVRAMERTGDIMMLHSMRLGDMSADSLKVTIRPGAGIELAVELHHGEKGIEATATLKSGNFHFMNSNWSDLQQRMEARGVRLSSLTNSDSSANSNAGQFQQPRRQAGQQQDDPAFAGAFAEFVMAGSIAKQAVQTVSTRGFESWA